MARQARDSVFGHARGAFAAARISHPTEAAPPRSPRFLRRLHFTTGAFARLNDRPTTSTQTRTTSLNITSRRRSAPGPRTPPGLLSSGVCCACPPPSHLRLTVVAVADGSPSLQHIPVGTSPLLRRRQPRKGSRYRSSPRFGCRRPHCGHHPSQDRTTPGRPPRADLDASGGSVASPGQDSGRELGTSQLSIDSWLHDSRGPLVGGMVAVGPGARPTGADTPGRRSQVGKPASPGGDGHGRRDGLHGRPRHRLRGQRLPSATLRVSSKVDTACVVNI